MPLYEYQCESCEHRFERIQKFSDPPIAVCPSCGGPVKKLLSSPAIQFKGSGWYITDYAKKPASGDGTAATDGKAAKDGKADTGSKDASSASPPAPSKESKDSSSTTAKKD